MATSPEPGLGPITTSERIASLDVLRGFALLGILAMNIKSMSMPWPAYFLPTFYFPYEGWNCVVHYYTEIFFSQKMFSLFAVLFGAGVVLYGARAKGVDEIRRVRWLWLRRMVWLFVIGIAHAYLLWEGDILTLYSLCGLSVLWWIRNLRTGLLLLLAVLCFVATPTISILSYLDQVGSRTARQHSTQRTPTVETVNRTRADSTSRRARLIEDSLRSYRGNFITVSAARADGALRSHLSMVSLTIAWRVLAMMILGILLMRWGVLQGERSSRFYGWLAVAGYAIGIPLVVTGILLIESHDFARSYRTVWGGHWNYVGSVVVMFGHLGLLLWLHARGFLKGIRKMLAAVGRTALSNYLLQSLLGSLIFYGYGLGLYGHATPPVQQAIVVAIWLCNLGLSIVWLQRFRFGPAEWLWRSLTYWRSQPFRRTPATGKS